MLKDRKVLIEEEITRIRDEAAHMYLSAMITESTVPTEYHVLRERITELQHDLAMVNKLIADGHA